jgi:hypothetical protein
MGRHVNILETADWDLNGQLKNQNTGE